MEVLSGHFMVKLFTAKGKPLSENPSLRVGKPYRLSVEATFDPEDLKKEGIVFGETHHLNVWAVCEAAQIENDWQELLPNGDSPALRTNFILIPQQGRSRREVILSRFFKAEKEKCSFSYQGSFYWDVKFRAK